MPEEFGTVNIKRGDRTRETEVLRQNYRRHREALTGMIAEAPNEQLGAEYKRLVVEIDTALTRLGELESRPPGTFSDTQPVKTEPGNRPLAHSPVVEAPAEGSNIANSRILMIVTAGIVVLGLIGWLLWRASSDERPARTPVVGEGTDTADTASGNTATRATAPPVPVPVAPVVPAVAISVDPSTNDYGKIRKGTRAARQFEVTNRTDKPIAFSVGRSACRCLYYEYKGTVAPRKKESITVTIDGARAKAGTLHETVKISSKKDKSIDVSFEVNATIR